MVLAMLPSLWDLTSHQDRSAALKKSGNGHKNCRFGSNVQPHLKIGLDKQVPEIPNVGAQVDENQGVHHGNLQELAASHKPQAGPREARLYAAGHELAGTFSEREGQPGNRSE
ncbi:hypothetical protein CGCFRS4_v015136 [Colletotrichum fructicola]|nr:hypothetical protein CGCFRS4_v015136 [Colletotrichum fructicola]